MYIQKGDAKAEVGENELVGGKKGLGKKGVKKSTLWSKESTVRPA